VNVACAEQQTARRDPHQEYQVSSQRSFPRG
jgi:hypothetical protein